MIGISDFRNNFFHGTVEFHTQGYAEISLHPGLGQGTRKIIGEVGVDKAALDSLHNVQTETASRAARKQIQSSLGGQGPGNHEPDQHKQHARKQTSRKQWTESWQLPFALETSIWLSLANFMATFSKQART